MFKHDSEFYWRLKREFYPSSTFLTTIAGIGIDTGAPVELEIAASGIAAVDMPTAGDLYAHIHPLPYDFDVQKPSYVRVLWNYSDTGNDMTVDWIVTYTAIIPGTTVIVTPVTALDRTINVGNGGAQTVVSATANIPQYTAYGLIDPDTLGEDVELMGWRVEMNAIVNGPGEVQMLGLELSYSPRKLQGGDGMRHVAPRTTRILGRTTAPGDFAP